MKLGAIEAGGTKFVVCIGDENGNIIDRASFPTEEPEKTMANVFQYFDDKDIEALGVGSFGPIDPDVNSPTYGYITTTPKPGWSNYNIMGALKERYDIPMGFDTDVNGAALGEATLYKVLNGDGTLGAMVSETVVDNEATAEIATNTTWGHYQIDIESEYLPTSDNMQGVVVETSDGKKYGMEHLENLWLRSGEIAFAVKDGFKVPQGNAIDYLRHEELQGKTITKITYLIKDAPDLVINTNLLCKKLLDEEYQATGKDAVYEDGVNVAMSIKAPEGSSYKLTEVSYKGNSLVAGTDYKYENNVLTVYKTANTGIGQYTLTYTDESYEDMTANVILTAGYNEGDVKLVDNKLVLPEGLDVATYLSSISGISVNGTALKGNNLGTAVFNEDGTVNFDAKITSRGNTTVVFPDASAEYVLDVQSIGYPSVSGTVVSPKDEPVDEIDTAALQSVIEKAEALKETDYTADSWSTLQIVLDEAKTILETKESQESVDNIAKALQSAIDALVKADNGNDLPSGDITNGNNSSTPSPDNSGDKTDSNDPKTGDPASIWGWMSLAISSF